MIPAPLNLRPARPLLATLLMAAGIVVFVLAALAGAYGLRETRDLTDVRGQRYEDLILIESVLSELKDLETGQRGFLITGEEAFLEPYFKARRNLDALYGAMRAKLADAALPEGFWPRLDRLVRDRVSLAERNIQLRRDGKIHGQGELEQLAEGKAVMDAVRREFDTLDDYRRQEIRGVSADLEEGRRQAFGFMLGAALLGFVLMLGALLMFRREQKLRLEAEGVLASANQRLEQTVQDRTRELRAALERIREFASTLDQGIEAERRRLAREVHDQIGQIFTAMKLLVRSWTEHFAGEPRLQSQFDEFIRLLDEGVNTARRITAELQPPLLDDLGLGAALEHHCTKYAAPAGLACRIELLHDQLLSRPQATALFRIAQEALTNTLRHAGARTLVIDDSLEAGEYCLAIEDDGTGMAAESEASFGLRGMAERAQLAGGSLAMAAGRSGGLRVEIRLPVIVASEENPA